MSEELMEDFFSQTTRPGRNERKSKLTAPRWNEPEVKSDINKEGKAVGSHITPSVNIPEKINVQSFKVVHDLLNIKENTNNINGVTRSSVVNNTNIQRVKKYHQYTPRSLRVTSKQINFLNSLCDDIHYTRRNSENNRDDGLHERITYNSVLRVMTDVLQEKFELKKDLLNYNIESEDELRKFIKELFS